MSGTDGVERARAVAPSAGAAVPEAKVVQLSVTAITNDRPVPTGGEPSEADVEAALDIMILVKDGGMSWKDYHPSIQANLRRRMRAVLTEFVIRQGYVP